MTYIRVNHKRLALTVAEIDEQIQRMQKLTQKADSSVSGDGLKKVWRGKDKDRFVDQWKNAAVNKNSSYSEMMKHLEEYADFLNTAYKKYLNAQSEAISNSFGLE